MRSMIISIIVLALVLVGGLLVYNSVKYDADDFINGLNRLSENINEDDWSKAREEFSEIERKWNSSRDMWAIFLDHHEIDNIDLAMAKASEYVKANSTDLSLGEIKTLKKLFSIVKENEAISLTNIL